MRIEFMIVLLCKEGKDINPKTCTPQDWNGFYKQVFLFHISQGHGTMEMLMVEDESSNCGQTHNEWMAYIPTTCR